MDWQDILTDFFSCLRHPSIAIDSGEGTHTTDTLDTTLEDWRSSQSIYQVLCGRPRSVSLLHATRKIEGGRYLGIDGGRYLGVYGDDNYYISELPQLIKGERMDVSFKGLLVFKIDGADSDYFDLVTLGILMWNDSFDKYTGDYDDFCNTWVSGDKKLYDLLSEQYNYELEEEDEEIIYLPPFVCKYPRNSEKIPAQWTLDRFLVVFLTHTIRLCADMRNSAGLSRTTYEKEIHPLATPLLSDTDSDYDSDSDSEFMELVKLFSGRGLEFHRYGCFTKGLELPGRRYLGIDGNGKYCISYSPEPIEAERIPTKMSHIFMFRIDRGRDSYDLVSFGIISRNRKDYSACVCGDERLHSNILSYANQQPEDAEWFIKYDPVVYLPPFVVKYPKKEKEESHSTYSYVEGGDRSYPIPIPEKPGIWDKILDWRDKCKFLGYMIFSGCSISSQI